MTETANIVKVLSKDFAVVALERTSACGDCTVCKSDKALEVTVLNTQGAKYGDKVLIEIEHLKKSITFFAYILPILLLIAGYILGFFVSKLFGIKGEGFAIIISALFFTVYILIAIRKIKKQNKITGKIIKIIN